MEVNAQTAIDRFRRRVLSGPGDECWNWQGRLSDKGYGLFDLNKKEYRAHRVSWQIYHQRQIPDGLCVLHTCDNRRCVNPKHLFTGTNLDNIQDMVRKGRRRVVQAKLDKDKVRLMRTMAAQGMKTSLLAQRFGVGHSSARRVVARTTYRHVD